VYTGIERGIAMQKLLDLKLGDHQMTVVKDLIAKQVQMSDYHRVVRIHTETDSNRRFELRANTHHSDSDESDVPSPSPIVHD
jgi:uncharacterized protein (DUF1015 family)